MIPPAGWIALGLGTLAHIIASVWWASHINTLLGVLTEQLKVMSKELTIIRTAYVSKEEFAYRIAQSDKEHAGMWKRIDELAAQ